MMLQFKTILRSSLLGVALTAAVGCSGQPAPQASEDPFFPPRSERRVSQIFQAQASAGAREDATLQAYHFDGARLNSLGEQKLDLMIPTNPDSEIMVHLNLSDEQAGPARRDAVMAYLGNCGVDASRIKLATGSNPNAGAPAANGLSRMDKTESTGMKTAGASAAATTK